MVFLLQLQDKGADKTLRRQQGCPPNDMIQRTLKGQQGLPHNNMLQGLT